MFSFLYREKKLDIGMVGRYIDSLKELHPITICSLYAVAAGFKPSSVLESINVNCWSQLRRFLEELGICYIYSSTNGPILSCPKELSSEAEVEARNLGLKINVVFEPSKRLRIEVENVLIARDPSILLELYKLYILRAGNEAERTARLGEILGYPKCCIDFFLRCRDPAEARHIYHSELIKRGLESKIPVEFWAVYHTPCTTNCRKTFELGKKYLRAIEEFSTTIYENVIERLSMVHLAWSIGRRYIDYNIVDGEIEEWFTREALRVLGENYTARIASIGRPFIYVYEMGDFPVKLTPETMGIKYVAFKASKGVIVCNPETNETYVCFTEEFFRGRTSYRYLSTVFREYRVILG